MTLSDSKRPLLAFLALFLLSLAWNALVHLVVLAEVNASVQHLRRADFGDQLWLSLLLTAAVVALFLAGYVRIARTGSWREGAVYGVAFGCLAGLLVDFNQYLVYPLPGRVAALWFAFGLVEFTGYGLLASRLCPPRLLARGRPVREPTAG